MSRPDRRVRDKDELLRKILDQFRIVLAGDPAILMKFHRIQAALKVLDIPHCGTGPAEFISKVTLRQARSLTQAYEMREDTLIF